MGLRKPSSWLSPCCCRCCCCCCCWKSGWWWWWWSWFCWWYGYWFCWMEWKRLLPLQLLALGRRWKWLEFDSETLGFDSERSGFAIEDMEFLESKALFQNPKSISSSVLLQADEGLVLGGLIWRDKSGCAGNSSIFRQQKRPLFFRSPYLPTLVVLNCYCFFLWQCNRIMIVEDQKRWSCEGL